MTDRSKPVWAIKLSTEDSLADDVFPLYEAWSNQRRERAWAGEPQRPLLFETAEAARAFVREKNAYYKSRPKGTIISRWRMNVVKVRVEVTPC